MTARIKINPLLIKTLALLLLLTACSSLPKEVTSDSNHFFPPNAPYYLAFNPKKFKASELPVNLDAEHEKVANHLFKRSNRAMFFHQDIGFTGYFTGKYPKKIIDNNLARSSNFVAQKRGFRDKSSGLEFFIANKNELYLSQNSLDSILDQKNPPLNQLFSPLVHTALVNDDFALVITDSSKTFANNLGSFAILSSIKLLRLSLNKVHGGYDTTIQLECANAITARAVSVALRTIRPLIIKNFDDYRYMDVTIAGNSVIVNGITSNPLNAIEQLVKGGS